MNTIQPLECIHGSNSRVHQIASCQQFQLHEKTLDIEKQYEIGSEIILFSSRDELRELCKYYLNNPDKRALIANKAYIRAMRDHTYKSRFYEIIEDLKIGI